MGDLFLELNLLKSSNQVKKEMKISLNWSFVPFISLQLNIGSTVALHKDAYCGAHDTKTDVDADKMEISLSFYVFMFDNFIVFAYYK